VSSAYVSAVIASVRVSRFVVMKRIKRPGGRNEMHGPRTRGLLRDEEGAVSLEMLLWVVLFLQFTMLTMDIGWVYWKHSEMWTVAGETVRETSLGALDANQSAVEAYVQERLDPGYAVTFIDNATTQTVTISANAADMSLLGMVTFFFDQMNASATMMVERP